MTTCDVATYILLFSSAFNLLYRSCLFYKTYTLVRLLEQSRIWILFFIFGSAHDSVIFIIYYFDLDRVYRYGE